MEPRLDRERGRQMVEKPYNAEEIMAKLREVEVELATTCGRYGYRRITALPRRESWEVSHKRVYRLDALEGLTLPHRQPKRSASKLLRMMRLQPLRLTERWSMDFIHDAL